FANALDCFQSRFIPFPGNLVSLDQSLYNRQRSLEPFSCPSRPAERRPLQIRNNDARRGNIAPAARRPPATAEKPRAPAGKSSDLLQPTPDTDNYSLSESAARRRCQIRHRNPDQAVRRAGGAPARRQP